MKQNYVDIGFGEAADMTGIEEDKLRAMSAYRHITNGADVDKTLNKYELDAKTYEKYKQIFDKQRSDLKKEHPNTMSIEEAFRQFDALSK